MNTLLQKAQLYTYVKNVASFEYFFKLLKKYEDGGIVNPVQVYTMEQNLVKGIETMLQNWNQYRQSLDLFRIQLGLPTNLVLELDDEPIQPMYDLIDLYEKTSIYYAQAMEASRMAASANFRANKVREDFRKVLQESNLVKPVVHFQQRKEEVRNQAAAVPEGRRAKVATVAKRHRTPSSNSSSNWTRRVSPKGALWRESSKTSKTTQIPRRRHRYAQRGSQDKKSRTAGANQERGNGPAFRGESHTASKRPCAITRNGARLGTGRTRRGRSSRWKKPRPHAF